MDANEAVYTDLLEATQALMQGPAESSVTGAETAVSGDARPDSGPASEGAAELPVQSPTLASTEAVGELRVPRPTPASTEAVKKDSGSHPASEVADDTSTADT